MRRRGQAFFAGTFSAVVVAVAVAIVHPTASTSFASERRSQPAGTALQVRADEPRLRLGDLAPDLRVLPPSDVYVVDDRDEGGTLRLKFTTVVWNAGEGPIEIRGSADERDAVRVRQVVHREDGEPRDAGPVGSFDFDHRHGHVHLSSFARYELWSLRDGMPVARVAENDKVGFCLMDNLEVDASRVVQDERYDDGCDAGVQGISPGWGDRYVSRLYEQDLVIDGLPDGRYRLVNVANPAGALVESRLDNNVASVDVWLEGGTVSLAGDD